MKFLIVRGRFLIEDKPKFRMTHLQGTDGIYFHNIIHKRKSFGKNFFPQEKRPETNQDACRDRVKIRSKSPVDLKVKYLCPKKLAKNPKPIPPRLANNCRSIKASDIFKPSRSEKPLDVSIMRASSKLCVTGTRTNQALMSRREISEKNQVTVRATVETMKNLIASRVAFPELRALKAKAFVRKNPITAPARYPRTMELPKFTSKARRKQLPGKQQSSVGPPDFGIFPVKVQTSVSSVQTATAALMAGWGL